MRRITYLFLFGTAFFLMACDKKVSPPASNQSFLITSAGSNWQFIFRDNVTSTNTNYTLTSTGRDTTINARGYKVYTRSGGGNEYFAQTANDYYQFANFSGLGTQVELLILKADLNKGATWEEQKQVTIPGVGVVNGKFNYQIMEKGISHVVDSKTYTDVTQVKITLSFTVPGLPLPITPITDINFYFAKGIGRIYNRIKINLNAPPLPVINVDTEDRLQTYTIVP